VRGWETAAAAQARILRAVRTIAAENRTEGSVAIVSHGAVGTLLYCHLAGEPIARRWDQPRNGGGNYYPFEVNPERALGWWQPIDGCAPIRLT
jgi:broad specificity phosphatase PhoE